MGIGGYLGAGNGVAATNDGRDNDDDGFIDEFGEERNENVLSVYPEAGLHFWMNSKMRLSLLAQYHVTPQSDVNDFGYIGIQWSVLDGLGGLWNGDSTDEFSPLREDELP